MLEKPTSVFYFGGLTVEMDLNKVTTMIIASPEKLIYHEVYSGTHQPFMYSKAVRFLA